MTTSGRILAVMVAVSLFSVAGCAGVADRMAGLGVVSESVSTLDGATIVEVTPQFLHDPKRPGWAANTYKLGARWNSLSPDYVALIMSFSSYSSSPDATYTNLTGLDVMLNGQKYTFRTGGPTSHDNSGWNSTARTIFTESQNSVIVPLELLREMTVAEDCRIRIHSTDGYEDALFSLEYRPGGQRLAVLSIRDFLDRVDQKRRELALVNDG